MKTATQPALKTWTLYVTATRTNRTGSPVVAAEVRAMSEESATEAGIADLTAQGWTVRQVVSCVRH